MAENKIHGSLPQLDLQQILQEVHTRWLRASEICHILRNYQKFYVKPEPPCKPPGGSLFLFDRKALRYFRKDGHRWRKKKDGKTVREAHEKLKSGSKDVLHCYYAHGEDNENFQRRSYWLLDPELDHIVLVHYREVEGNRPGVSHSSNTDPVITNYFEDPRTNSATCSIPVQSSGRGTQASSPSTIDWNGHVPSSEFEDGDSGDDYAASSVAQPVSSSRIQISSHENGPAEGIFQGYRGIMPFPSSSGLMNSTVIGNVSFSPLYVNQAVPSNIKLSTDQTINRRASQEGGSVHGASYSTVANATLSSSSDILSLNGKTSCSDPMTRRLISSMLGGNSAVKDSTDVGYKVQPNASQPTVARDVQRSAQEHPKEDGDKCTQQFPDKRVIDDARHIYQVPHDLPFHAMPQYQMNDGFSIPSNDHSVEVETNCRPVKDAPEGGLNHHEGLKKLDSFGRWMDKEIGGDCDDSLMPSDSSSYWNTLDTHPEKQEVPSLSHRMQLDIDSLCPSLAQEQLFSICDFSPDWGYSGVETKVLISGVFLSDMNHPSSMKWCCMFGELEVPAEVLTAYALRCQAPSHATGRVPFYITCGNRLACSEVREFEYRENSSNSNLLSEKTEAEEEVHFQVRFAKMLFHGRDGSSPSCSIEKCNKCSLQNDIRRMQTDHENEWGKIENIIRASEVNRKDPRDILIENFSKPKLCEWLICKIHEEGKGPNVLDEEGQGVIHLAAALGYEWAMYPIVAAGVNPSFRDARGRTGLHWAACFGREETVASLIRLRAPPDAVEDPTSKFPEGRTAADLASSRGHKGIAGYLAEAHLTSQLLSLTLQESVMGSVFATLAAEKAIESVQMEGLVSLNSDGRDMISLRRSLDAVRNSAQAAARIQTAFRVQSFRLRQLTKSNDENSEIEMLVGSLNKTEKMGDFNDHLHGAAVKIQRKYRGWKGRKDYLKMRNRVVKIQAHVRGYRVRKQYRKLVWSVGILEKVILRWRRKRSGLRGFTAVKAGGTIEPGIGKIDEYDFLRQGRKQKEAGVEKALARVHSMARYQESRDQYMRLVTQFQKYKIKDRENATTEDQNQEEKRAREDILSPMID